MRVSTAAILTPLLPVLLSSRANAQNQDLVLNEYFYCIKYYGSVVADIDLPSDGIPTYNYDGTELCALNIRTPYVGGATLEICPPDSSFDVNNLALTATLALHASGGELNGPIDNLELSPTLITNGSVPASVFENNGIPAVVTKDTEESTTYHPEWIINGTQASLSDYPDATDRTQSVYISCDYPSFNQYCGGYEDTHDTVTGGCWRDQSIWFNMQTPMNFTFRFDNVEATVDIWVESEYETAMGNRTGTNTQLHLEFSGNRRLPSVVDYDYWEESDSNYELEQEYLAVRQGLALREDEQGLPIIVNETETGEWYDSANGTFSTQSINGDGVRVAGLTSLWVVGWTMVLGFALSFT